MALSDGHYAEAVIDPGPLVYNPLLRIDYAHLGGRTVRRVCGRCGNAARHYPHRVEGGTVWLCCFCGKTAKLPGGTW
jgi:hypothetical protein